MTAGPIGIVGAGITGLTLHRALRERGIESVVFESTACPGGMMRTKTVDGFVLDSGPQRTRLTPPVQSLVDALDLEAEILVASEAPMYVFHNDRLRVVPNSLRRAITTDLLSLTGKARLLLEPILGGQPRPGESVERYLRRAFGPEFASRVGGPLYAGLYASDPADMPVEFSLARALDRFGVSGSVLLFVLRSKLRGRSPPPMISFREGMETLPRAIADRYRDGIGYEDPVREITAIESGFELAAADARRFVEEVVLTTPAPTAAALLARTAPDLSDVLCDLSYNPIVTVHLHAPNADLNGAGHKLLSEDGFHTRGVTWTGPLFADSTTGPVGRADLFTCYLGGAGDDAILERSDERIGTVAAEEFQAVTDVPATPIEVTRITPGMPAYDRTWATFERVTVPEGVHLCANYTGRAGIPGRISAARSLASDLVD